MLQLVGVSKYNLQSWYPSTCLQTLGSRLPLITNGFNRRGAHVYCTETPFRGDSIITKQAIYSYIVASYMLAIAPTLHIKVWTHSYIPIMYKVICFSSHGIMNILSFVKLTPWRDVQSCLWDTWLCSTMGDIYFFKGQISIQSSNNNCTIWTRWMRSEISMKHKCEFSQKPFTNK